MKNELDKYLEYAERINAINHVDVRQVLFKGLLNQIEYDGQLWQQKISEKVVKVIGKTSPKEQTTVHIIRNSPAREADFIDLKNVWRKAIHFLKEFPAILCAKHNFTVYVVCSGSFDTGQDNSDPFYFLEGEFKVYVEKVFNTIESPNNTITFVIGGDDIPNSVMIMFIKKERFNNPTKIEPKFIDVSASRTYL